MVFAAAAGYVEGRLSDASVQEDSVVGLSLGLLLAGLSVISMAAQSYAGQSFSVVTNLTLTGSIFSGMVPSNPLLVLIFAVVYGVVDFLFGWGIARVVQDFEGELR